MTIEEVYGAIGGDFNQALGRLMRPALVQKFAQKFLNDKSYGQLINAMERSDTEAAFNAAHTLKGVCRNLAFAKLDMSVSALTEVLRDGNMEAAQAMIDTVSEDYDITVKALQQLQ